MNELETVISDLPCLIRPNSYSAKNNVKPVNSHCVAPEAGSVSLVGDFNGWNPLANRMHRQPDGSWTEQIDLHHGYHHYLFLVDDEPMLDPNAYGIARDKRNERVSLPAIS